MHFYRINLNLSCWFECILNINFISVVKEDIITDNKTSTVCANKWPPNQNVQLMHGECCHWDVMFAKILVTVTVTILFLCAKIFLQWLHWYELSSECPLWCLSRLCHNHFNKGFSTISFLYENHEVHCIRKSNTMIAFI